MQIKFKVLDLFSGIGGFSYGLERAQTERGGYKTIAFCETNPYCRKVLRKHWPTVRQYEDIKLLTANILRADGIDPDVICGGFPCQDLSVAGKGKGLKGERSGLWWEFHRLIKEITPQWVIVENVSVLRSRGLDQVLRSLAEIGYDAEWHCIPASAVGAPHQRDRIWIISYPNKGQCNGENETLCTRWNAPDTSGQDVPNSMCKRLQGQFQRSEQAERPIREERQSIISFDSWLSATNNQWAIEPNVGRVANGVPNRVDRLKCLGNAVVPQIPELIGRAILEAKVTNGALD